MKLTGALLALIVIAGSAFLWKSIDDVKSQATASITAAQNGATHEISEISRSAQDTAKAEAQKAIDVAFDKQNVNA